MRCLSHFVTAFDWQNPGHGFKSKNDLSCEKGLFRGHGDAAVLKNLIGKCILYLRCLRRSCLGSWELVRPRRPDSLNWRSLNLIEIGFQSQSWEKLYLSSHLPCHCRNLPVACWLRIKVPYQADPCFWSILYGLKESCSLLGSFHVFPKCPEMQPKQWSESEDSGIWGNQGAQTSSSYYIPRWACRIWTA